MLYRPALHGNWNALSLARRALKEQIPHANGSTHNCFAKSSGISAGPCIILQSKHRSPSFFQNGIICIHLQRSCWRPTQFILSYSQNIGLPVSFRMELSVFISSVRADVPPNSYYPTVKTSVSQFLSEWNYLYSSPAFVLTSHPIHIILQSKHRSPSFFPNGIICIHLQRSCWRPTQFILSYSQNMGLPVSFRMELSVFIFSVRADVPPNSYYPTVKTSVSQFLSEWNYLYSSPAFVLMSHPIHIPWLECLNGLPCEHHRQTYSRTLL